METLWCALFGFFILAVVAGIWIGLRLSRDSKRQDPLPRPLYRPSKCGRCGYDLRVATDRCPECGWWIPTPYYLPSTDDVADRLNDVR